MFENAKVPCMHNEQSGVLFIPPMNSQSSLLLEECQTRLAQLKNHILDVQKEVQSQNEEITQRLKAIEESKILKIAVDYTSSNESIKHYVSLLQEIMGEIDKEASIIEEYRSLHEETFLALEEGSFKDFDSFVREKVNDVKRQIKRIEKDVHVSFSRYKFSYDNHRKRLDYLENVVRYGKAMQEAHTAKQKDAAPKSIEQEANVETNATASSETTETQG